LLKKRIIDEQSIMLRSNHIDELNNNRGTYREDSASAENKTIVDKKARGPANGQIEPRHPISPDHKVVEDFPSANGLLADLKCPFADFIRIVSTGSRTVNRN
jgi:hypothetical protein